MCKEDGIPHAKEQCARSCERYTYIYAHLFRSTMVLAYDGPEYERSLIKQGAKWR